MFISVSRYDLLDHTSSELRLSCEKVRRLSVLLGKRHIAFQRLVFAEASRFPKVGVIWFAHGP